MPKPLPSPEFLHKVLRYEPETGKLFWLPRNPSMFVGNARAALHVCNSWNSRYAKMEAFTATDDKGYKHGAINNRMLKAHRVIWALVYGQWPSDEIDHINGSKSDNRLSNLRVVSKCENAKNKSRQKSNTSGVVGVYWYKRDSKWAARIAVDRKSIHLGYFDRKDDAVCARKSAEIKYGFHKNHGRA